MTLYTAAGYPVLQVTGLNLLPFDMLSTLLSTSSAALRDFIEGQRWTFNGSAADDVISAGNQADAIVAHSGNDTVYGLQGTDHLEGGSGNDIIDGGIGADVMVGGTGDDTLYVDDGADNVIELSGAAGGSDTVISSVSYALAVDAAVERFIASSRAATTALNFSGNNFAQNIGGNNGANVLQGLGGDDGLIGNGGSDRLFGGLGNDTLIGGAGNDLFFFNTAPNSATNHDVIADFGRTSGNTDKIYLDNAVFASLATGVLGGAFASNATGAAVQADDRVIYETDTGNLYYDSNGTAAGGSTLFATVTGHPAMLATDFVVF